MARPSRRRRHARHGDRGRLVLGIALSIAAILGLAGLGAAYFLIKPAPTLDSASLCPVTGPRSVTVVLIDASDDLPAVTRREISTLLNNVVEKLPPYGLLDIRVLDPAANGSRSIFARCNPGDGSGLSEWTANPAMARRRWVASFQGPVTTAISSGLGDAESSTSPIMAAIQDIAVARFTSLQSQEGSRRLVIVSDMIEHESYYSQYTGNLSFGRYRASPAYKRYSTDLHGADVVIWYVQRLLRNPIDSVAHIRFWQDWVADNKGHLSEAIRLQGAGP